MKCFILLSTTTAAAFLQLISANPASSNYDSDLYDAASVDEFEAYFNAEFDCYDKTDSGASYTGNTSKSRSGRPCQKWTDNSPVDLHKFQKYFMKRSNVNIREFPENHCRNPGGLFRGPVCIVAPTADKTNRYDYCDIPKCEEVEEKIDISMVELENRPDVVPEEGIDADAHSSSNVIDGSQVKRAYYQPQGQIKMIRNEKTEENKDEDKNEEKIEEKPKLPKENCGRIIEKRDCWKGSAKFACYKPSKKARNRYLPCPHSDAWVTPLECSHESLVWNHKIFTCDYPNANNVG